MIRQSDINAIAETIDPVCFMPEFITIDKTLEFRNHMLARRRSARRIARIAIEVLIQRGWDKGN